MISRLARLKARAPLILPLVGALVGLLVVGMADARPGGGNTYRGSGRSRSGGSSFGGGGGGGDGDLFLLGYYLVRLLFAVPEIGIPVLLILGLFVVLRYREGVVRGGWESSVVHHPRRVAPKGGVLSAMRVRDPDFSVVSFEDFLQALFCEVHAHRGGNRLAQMAPYVEERVRSTWARTPVDAVRGVIVGAMKVVSLREAPGPEGRPHVFIDVDLEANYTEETKAEARTFYVRERWTLHRAAAARSRAPAAVRTFQCPNCGAPLDRVHGRTCGYCSQIVDTGEFDWVVSGVTTLERESRPPALGGDAPEVGTDEPTRVDPDAPRAWEALVQRDPAQGWSAFVARVELMFAELGKAWSARDIGAARPFVTDPLLSTWAYWLEAYRSQGLWNQNEQARITTVHLARVLSDRYFDAVTVRIFASSLDFTLDREGAVVAGSRSRPRDYSEYWTLVRSRARKGGVVSEKRCPSCGAPLSVEMTGACRHCQSRVTTGDFDWVLSRIEQDESYEG